MSRNRVFKLRLNNISSILTHQKKYLEEENRNNTQGPKTKKKMQRLQEQINCGNLICFKCKKIIKLGSIVKKSGHPGSGSSLYRHASCIVYY